MKNKMWKEKLNDYVYILKTLFVVFYFVFIYFTNLVNRDFRTTPKLQFDSKLLSSCCG